MPKQGKTPKKKSKEKTPQKSGESEYPAMDQEELNELVQNAIEQSQAQLQQKHEEQIKRLEADREAQMKVVEERLTRKFEDEVRELNRAFEESRGENPTTKDTTWMRKIMEEAVVAANNASLHTQKPYIPNRFLGLKKDKMRSCTGSAIFTFHCLTQWYHGGQSIASNSTLQSELIGASTTADKAAWFYHFMNSYPFLFGVKSAPSIPLWT